MSLRNQIQEEELDEYFKEDSTQSIFLAIDDLEKFRRGDLSMTEHISEFHRKVYQINELLTDKTQEIYHDSIKAYKLLVQADLKPEEVTLVKAAMGKEALSTANIEESLKRCYGDKVFLGHRNSRSSESVRIKTEPTDTYYEDDSATEDERAYYNARKNTKYSRRYSGKQFKKYSLEERKNVYQTIRAYF
jgi:hypothetical protein